MTVETNSETEGAIGIIAGGGSLPARLIEAAQARGREVVLLTFEDFAEAGLLGGVRHIRARFGEAVSAMNRLADMGVSDVVMAGSIKRPSFAELKPDFATAKVAARVFSSAFGDDSLLRALIGEIENMGFRVLPVEDVLPSLTAPPGVWGQIMPDRLAEQDIARGLDVARKLGGADVGQSVAVQQGIVLAVEAAEGTAALLRRCADHRRNGPGGVLVKISKPGQDNRADLPVIGPDTVKAANQAGLRGIAVEAGRCLVIDRDEVISRADAASLFLTGIEVETDSLAAGAVA